MLFEEDAAMRVETTPCRDDLGLSGILRGLASDARRVIGEGSASPREVAALSHRIQCLREFASAEEPSPLLRWLDGLQRQIDRLGRVRAAS
jgi:hypothetical protein